MRRRQQGGMVCLAALMGWVAAAGACGQTAATNAPGLTPVRVLDVDFTDARFLRIGTNTVSLGAATNVLAVGPEDIDLIAIHGAGAGPSSSNAVESAIAKIAGIGVPMVIVEKDGDYAWREQSGGDGKRIVTVGTDQLAALRRLWLGSSTHLAPARETTVRTTVEWDGATGEYGLRQVELGLFGDRVWLVREQRESDTEGATFGIQIMKTW